MDENLYLGVVASFAAAVAPTPEDAWRIAREVAARTPSDLESATSEAWRLAVQRFTAF